MSNCIKFKSLVFQRRCGCSSENNGNASLTVTHQVIILIGLIGCWMSTRSINFSIFYPIPRQFPLFLYGVWDCRENTSRDEFVGNNIDININFIYLVLHFSFGYHSCQLITLLFSSLYLLHLEESLSVDSDK